MCFHFNFFDRILFMEKELITEDIKAALRSAFKELSDDVLIEVYTKIGVNDMFNDLAVDLIEAMAEASGKIKIKLYKLGDENSRIKMSTGRRLFL